MREYPYFLKGNDIVTSTGKVVCNGLDTVIKVLRNKL